MPLDGDITDHALARALGRIEANQESSKARHDEMARTIQSVRDNIHSLRNDLQTFVGEQRDHERRISQLEMLPPLVSAMTGFGERLKQIEHDATTVAAYIAAEKGVRGFLKWAFTAGCGFIGAAAAFLGLWLTTRG